ncbi:hypothetical protein CALCODRAFT_484081 [Calocera cornea HHB12733]|uniref:Uncharacterized protein n=1 Tax=Calocera cornea HHB12733 TaxID=1353952 RepID=A0A165F6E1_9BASI|nr:hypothetical protein CALCODRAFT_484081 [Calocera cornea HHB12733]
MPVDPTNYVPGTYMVLTWRSDGFHWMITTDDGSTARWAFHAVNQLDGLAGWMYEMRNFSPVSSFTALAAVQIGPFIPQATLNAWLSAIPMQTHVDDLPAAFTCRLWFRHAIRVLTAAGLINCIDINGLEAEGNHIGGLHRNVAFENQLGGVYRSKFCIF